MTSLHRAAALAALSLTTACATLGGATQAPPDPAGAGDRSLAAQLARAAAPAPGPRYVFVGVALSDDSPAFLGDITILDRMLEHQYGARYRSILLSNHEQVEAVRELPLATPEQLEAVFARLREIRGPEDRFIVVFTSHGRRGKLQLRQRDARLQTTVDAGAIERWMASLAPNRTWVVISSCYSGSLLDAVGGPNVVAMSASEADRMSLGCGTLNRTTFFVGALARSLDAAKRFAEVWADTTARIERWERELKYPGSKPQIRYGAEVRGLERAPLSEF